MIVYPAIDLRGGRVVRLVHGDPARQTAYSDDPVAVAERWKAAGAEWLHMINLDGALTGLTDVPGVLAKLAAVGLPVQFGGGLRSLDDAARAIDAGASRIILGTPAVQQPELAGQAVERFGAEAVAVALDARDGFVATHGWQATTPWTPVELGRLMAGMGVRYALYTDINRDGELSGVNIEATARLASQTGLGVIASGGVASLENIHALCAVDPPLAGVIIGTALYSGAVTLEDAIRAARGTGRKETTDAG